MSTKIHRSSASLPTTPTPAAKAAKPAVAEAKAAAQPIEQAPKDSAAVKQLPGKTHAPTVSLHDDHPAPAKTQKVSQKTGPVTKTVRVSSYGPGLYGNPTANGTRLTPNTVGLAHKTLPLGTVVDVTVNGKTVSAKVIDRGPYVSGREFDLTNGLIKQLGFPNCDSFGVRKVQVQIHHR